MKPLFIDKVQAKYKMTVFEKKVVSGEVQEQVDSEKLISEDQVVTEVFNNFFINTLY